MNEQLLKFLRDLNCSVINPVQKSLTDKTVVGWYCKSTSALKVGKHCEQIEQFINKNNIEYYLSGPSGSTANFFIYINKKESNESN